MNQSPITFVYHFFTNKINDEDQIPISERPYYLELSKFEEHLIFLSRLGLQGISIESFLSRQLQNNILNLVILTFDDGHLSNYTLAVQLLKKYNFSATFFVVTAWGGTAQCMTWEQIRELANTGMEIGSHTSTHPFLIKLSPQAIKREFEDSKKMIEDQIQKPCKFLAIPYGFTKPEYEDIAQECGYKGICDSKVSFRSDINSDFCRIHRIGVRSHCDVNWLRSVMEANWVLKSRMVLHDRLKSFLKKSMGLESWLSFRELFLRHKYRC